MLLQIHPLKMKGIEYSQAYIFYFFLCWSWSFLNQQNGIPFDFCYFVFITHFFYNRINEQVDSMRTMLEFSTSDELGESADVGDQYRC